MKNLEEILSIIDNKLFNEYTRLVQDLETKVYSCINEALAIDNGIYTNHDKEHFDLVVEQAGYLLNAEKILEIVYKQNDIKQLSFDEKKVFFFLNSMELFILLCSIRVHDIGLIVDREHHSTNILYTISMLNIEIKAHIKQLIAEISSAHTGKTLDGSKDKICNLLKDTKVNSASIRPQVLAAIVRFSDELEEGTNRTNNTMIIFEKVQETNIVFHKYSLSLSDLSINTDERRIILTFYILETEKEIYTKPNKDQVTLLEEIYNRLQKLEQERKYFHRFLCSTLSIEKIECKILITDEYSNPIDNISVSTFETYPEIEEHGLARLKEYNEDKKNDN